MSRRSPASARPPTTSSASARGRWSVTDADSVPAAVAGFADDYRSYFERNAARLGEDGEMLSPLPEGRAGAGARLRRRRAHAGAGARVNADHRRPLARGHGEGHRCLRRASAWLTEEEVFDFDYWPMELRKLKLAPAPPPGLAGRTVALAGIDDPLRTALAARLGRDGAMVVDGAGGGGVGGEGVERRGRFGARWTRTPSPRRSPSSSTRTPASSPAPHSTSAGAACACRPRRRGPRRCPATPRSPGGAQRERANRKRGAG